MRYILKRQAGNAVIIIIAANILMFILQMFLGDRFTASLMLVSKDVFSRPWILLSHMFLHGSPSHLFFNMYALYMFGTLIEQKIGTVRFLFIYFLSGILAGLIPTYSAALGASGALMGILGVTIMLLPNLQVLFFFFIPMSMRTAGIIFALMDLFGMFSPVQDGIAHYAHLVGLACGLIFGYYLLQKKSSFQKKFTYIPAIKNKRKNKLHTFSNTIELDEDEIEEYLKNGRL